MRYDFTKIIDRHGKDAIAVDGLGKNPGFAPEPPKDGFDVIPMWVADMNFETVPTIPKAIMDRAAHPAYGYFSPVEEYYDSIIRWHKIRNNVEGLMPEYIGYENGVLGGVISALTAFAAPGDAVLLHSPTYIGFTKCITENGYKIVHSPLKKDEKGIWRMDYEDMDAKLKANNIHVAIFCSPHNPTGRVWERREIEEAMEVYKTFNLAGLVGSYHIIFNKMLRDRVEAKSRKSHYNTMNVLSMHALIGAYEAEGYTWVNELCQVLSENVDYAVNHIRDYYRGIEVSKPQGTYMLFLDCEDWCEENYKSLDELLKAGWDVGVAWQDGRPFHQKYGIRMNLALPLGRVKEAFERLDEYVFHV